MATLNFTARELRQKQAYVLDKADAGEEVIIWRGKNKAYMLTPVHENDKTLVKRLNKKLRRQEKTVSRVRVPLAVLMKIRRLCLKRYSLCTA